VRCEERFAVFKWKGSMQDAFQTSWPILLLNGKDRPGRSRIRDQRERFGRELTRLEEEASERRRLSWSMQNREFRSLIQPQPL